MLFVLIVVAAMCSCAKTDDSNNSGGGNGGNTYNGHAYVDLGLPSGTLWATCNVGATTPEGYGDYFAWGETEPKTTYNWRNYRYCIVDTIYVDGWYEEQEYYTKYSVDASCGYNGFVDNLTTLEPSDDAASVKWGNGWRMPTKEEWQELIDYCNQTWTNQNGVRGRLFTASNNKTIFIPAAGYYDGHNLTYGGDVGDYWSSTLDTDNIPGETSAPSTFFFQSGLFFMDHHSRCFGHSVRPVRSTH